MCSHPFHLVFGLAESLLNRLIDSYVAKDVAKEEVGVRNEDI